VSFIKLPRTQHPAHKERYDLIRRYGTSRKRMVEFITSIGGYSDRDGRWPIAFIVKMNPDLDADILWKIASKECDFGIHAWPAAKQTVAEHLFREKHAEHEQHLWEWGQEDMVRSAQEDDWFYSTWLGTEERFEWSLRGRSGGNLVIDKFAGIHMRNMNLEEALNEKWDRDFVISTAKVVKLFEFCVQWTCELKRERLEKECQYKAAWTLWANICEPEFDGRWKAYETRERLADEADELLTIVKVHCETRTGGGSAGCWEVETYRTICQLAGIQLKE
jgi:hypothetical protein